MKTLTAILFLLICSFVFAQPTIYIVRHAEKVDSWPDAHQAFQPLSSKGISTSDDLAIYFSEINLSAIYSSTTVRTMHTAHSTSLDKEIEITIHKAPYF